MSTATTDERRDQRVLLRVPDITARAAPAPKLTISQPEPQPKALPAPSTWSTWLAKIQGISWQYRVSLLAIIVGVVVIFETRHRVPPPAPPRQPTPINVSENPPPKMGAAPILVPESSSSQQPPVAAPPWEAPAAKVADDDRMAHRVFTPRAQPGVAEFEGTISSPILEATHERARPGIH